jgi:hypothetical protein
MNPTEQAIQGVVEETFASLAFMFPVEPEAGAAGEAAAMAWAAVDFTGPFGGALRLAVSAEMLEPLAANMLGLEDGVRPSPEQQQDAFKELLNVICGNLLPVIASPREVFSVHAPKTLAGPEAWAPAAGLNPAGTVDLDLDAGHVSVTLLVGDGALAGMTAPERTQL